MSDTLKIKTIEDLAKHCYKIEELILKAHRTASLSGCVCDVDWLPETGEVAINEYASSNEYRPSWHGIYRCQTADWQEGLELGAVQVYGDKIAGQYYIVETKDTVYANDCNDTPLGREATPEEIEEYEKDPEKLPRVLSETELYDALDWNEMFQEVFLQCRNAVENMVKYGGEFVPEDLEWSDLKGDAPKPNPKPVYWIDVDDIIYKLAYKLERRPTQKEVEYVLDRFEINDRLVYDTVNQMLEDVIDEYETHTGGKN